MVPLVMLGAVLGCAPRVPVAPEGPHTGDTPVTVPYPPPAARPETVPPQPAPLAVWVDGQWVWGGDAYSWQRGKWVVPVEGAYYARPQIVRRVGGGLVYFGGSWHRPAATAPTTGPSGARHGP